MNFIFEIDSLVLQVINELVKFTPKITQYLSVILILFVLNNFIKNQLIAKSNLLISHVAIWRGSKVYFRYRGHIF